VSVAAVICIVIYNRLVALRQARKNAFADIDVQLKQRTDLVPNLVETVKGYATHEKTVFEDVTAARARAMNAGTDVAARGQAEAALSGSLMKLMAVAENYPELKANQNFMSLQGELSDLENKIAASRRYFNNATTEYNTYSQQFPAVILANMMGFTQEKFLEFSDTEKAAMAEPPKVSFQ
jgi:LemA protein